METIQFSQQGHKKTAITFENRDFQKILETIARKLKRKYSTQISYNDNGKHQLIFNGSFNVELQEILNGLDSD